MTDHANELRRHARKIPHPQGETPGVMLRAADEIERLRAKIAEMERQEPVGVLHVGSYYGEELQDWEFAADQRVCDRLNEQHVTNPTSLKLYALPGAQPQLDEIKIALQRALELGARETWTGARKHRSWEDQREEQQCWNKVWSLLGAQGEEK